jgi:hypothetical protein
MPSKQERIEKFILVWVQHTMEHPDITLNDWLKTFGVLTGVAMNLADIDEELVDKAIDSVSTVAKKSYLDSKDHIKPSTLQ